MSRTFQTLVFDSALAPGEWSSGVIPTAQSHVEGTVSAIDGNFLMEIESRLAEIGRLEDDWDGYGGAGVSESAVRHARSIIASQVRHCGGLPLPDVAPTSSGTITIEWHDGESEAVVELGTTRVSGLIKPSRAPTLHLDGESQEMSEHLSSLIAAVLTATTRMSQPLTRIDYDQAENE